MPEFEQETVEERNARIVREFNERGPIAARRARDHAEEAEGLLNAGWTRIDDMGNEVIDGGPDMTRTLAHALLALYWQREARP